MPKEYGTPGPRAIYPEICDSRSLGRCGLVANALWPRLIAKADDQGRLSGDAGDVLSECFPKMLGKVTLRQVKSALDELSKAGQVQLYEVAGEPYIQVLTWWSWQASQRRAYPSRHPAPDGWSDYVYGFDDNPRTLREAQGREPRKRRSDEPGEAPKQVDLSTDDADGNRTGTAPEPHGAVAEPHRADDEPHGAALAGAQPRVRGAVPSPAMPSLVNSPQPPASGGRRTRARDLAPMRSPTNYDDFEKDDETDGSWLNGATA